MKVTQYYTNIKTEEWVILSVGEDGDAMLEDGYKRECSNTWWPDGKEPKTDDEWDDRYEKFVGGDITTEEVSLTKMKGLVHEHIGMHTNY